MKRRNADCGKLRRPIKRNKITEGMYGSTTVLYMKFLVLWAIVITADFMFMFRFEFLWPFWLLLRSVHDSFKYKGLAFSMLFVCIAITSDLVCLFFIPVNWLLFAASTYVWVQYVWHTDKGICLPTIILWMLFVYLEAGIRWKDSRHMPHLDLCRPFAAHCIGYPVVTLGFGFKSYVGYRMRQRKQREVAKENEFYMQLLQQALPQEESSGIDEAQSALTSNNASSNVSPNNLTHSVAPLIQNHQQIHQTNNHSSNNSLQAGASLSAAHSQMSNSIASSAAAIGSAIGYGHNHHHNHQSNSNNNATSNGHINSGGSAGKNHRRSVDKENRQKLLNQSQTTDNENPAKGNRGNYQQLQQATEVNSHNNINNNKEKSDLDSVYCQQQQVNKDLEKRDNHASGKSNKKINSPLAINSNSNGHSPNDNEEVATLEPAEKTKGRRNRQKRENASKDNHQTHCNNSSHPNNHVKEAKENNNHHSAKDTHHNHHNSDTSSVSSSSSSSSSSSVASGSNNTKSTSSAISQLASKVVSKICESCLKLEADVKKYRSEISHMKQIENELRQKLENNLTNKSCLQAKQKECDELEKRIHELTAARHSDVMQLQTVERRLQEERRQKQSLDAQLNNEKKARKLAEDKASRPECSSQCKQRKQQMDDEIKQLRRDLQNAEDSKQLAEQHGRKWEQELRIFEAEIRNRDSIQPGTEVLMNALASLQDKNCTLEKNLSAETRVKLDLFSALGDAKRQLEISESLRRSKDDEIHDLKAKIAQLLAVMPTDSLCLPSCSSTGASSMLRMNETPPMQTGPGPASPMLTSLNAVQAQQQQQLTGRVVVPTSASDYVQQTISSEYVVNSQQQQCSGVVPVSVGVQNNSNLDPNATVYTPKAPNNNVGGGVMVVGNNSDA